MYAYMLDMLEGNVKLIRYVFVCVHTSICICICTYIDTPGFVIGVYSYIYIYWCVFIHTHLLECIHTYTFIGVYTHIVLRSILEDPYVCMYVCMYVHVYAYVTGRCQTIPRKRDT